MWKPKTHKAYAQDTTGILSHVPMTLETWMDMHPTIKQYTSAINSHKPYCQEEHDGRNSDRPQDQSEYGRILWSWKFEIFISIYLFFNNTGMHQNMKLTSTHNQEFEESYIFSDTLHTS